MLFQRTAVESKSRVIITNSFIEDCTKRILGCHNINLVIYCFLYFTGTEGLELASYSLVSNVEISAKSIESPQFGISILSHTRVHNMLSI